MSKSTGSSGPHFGTLASVQPDSNQHQDLLTQVWTSFGSTIDRWAQQPPSWLPDALSSWLKSSEVPGLWVWLVTIVACVLLVSAMGGATWASFRLSRWLDWSWSRGERSRKMRRSPYQSRAILTPNEREFFGRLRRALMPRFVVFSQVSMSALLEPKPAHQGREYMRLRARFSQKYVDFVVCDPETVEVVALIELDDITHDPAKDALRDEMLEGAGYTVVRWHSRNKPSPQDISRTIERIFDQRSWMNTQPMD